VLKLLLGNKMFNDQIALLEKLSCKNLVVLTFYEHHSFQQLREVLGRIF
jgi:hypothetical protein